MAPGCWWERSGESARGAKAMHGAVNHVGLHPLLICGCFLGGSLVSPSTRHGQAQHSVPGRPTWMQPDASGKFLDPPARAKGMAEQLVPPVLCTGRQLSLHQTIPPPLCHLILQSQDAQPCCPGAASGGIVEGALSSCAADALAIVLFIEVLLCVT